MKQTLKAFLPPFRGLLGEGPPALRCGLQLLAAGATASRGLLGSGLDLADCGWRHLLREPALPLPLFATAPRDLADFDPADLDRAWQLVQRLDPAVLQAADLLGWAHQFWLAEEKDRVFAQRRATPSGKVEGADVAPATQLYTEDYMVEFLLQNSLAVAWQAPGKRSSRARWSWPLQLPADRPAGGQKADELTLLDPACGAGNFLLAAFAMLDAMRQAEGEKASGRRCEAILAKNLHGVDIDRLAVDLAQTALWMQAAVRSPGFDNWSLVTEHLTVVDHPYGSLAPTEELTDPLARSVLERTYSAVIANPPYMGAANLPLPMKEYLAQRYPTGKRDLYAAFLLRCRELTAPSGRTAMVTQQSWMFLQSYAALRAGVRGRGGLLRETAIETLAHLGPGAFDDISGEVVNVALFVLANRTPADDHRLTAIRLPDSSSTRKRELLRTAATAMRQDKPTPGSHRATQADLLHVQGAPLCYWLAPRFLQLLAGPQVKDAADLCQGLRTTDNARFVRLQQEQPPDGQRWFAYSKGGRYQKWTPLDWHVVDFENNGAEIESLALAKYPYLDGNSDWVIGSRHRYGEAGLTYSCNCRGSLGVRRLPAGSIFDPKGPGLFPRTIPADALMASLSARVTSYLLRAICPVLDFNPGYVAQAPLPPEACWPELAAYGSACVEAKERLAPGALAEAVSAEAEKETVPPKTTYLQRRLLTELRQAAVLHTLEGGLERLAARALELGESDQQAMYAEVGLPAGCQPLLAGYDRLPAGTGRSITATDESARLLSASLAAAPRLPATNKRKRDLQRRLQAMFAAGPAGAWLEEEGPSLFPTETFLESLAVRLGLHPVSVYGLLEESAAEEGWRCPAEEARLLEEAFTAALLESASSDPLWRQGVLTLAGPWDELQALLHRRLAPCAGEGWTDAWQTLFGKPWQNWLCEDFFRRHMLQFRRRPVLWQLQSGRFGRQGEPAYACLVDYRQLSEGALPAAAESAGESRAVRDWKRKLQQVMTAGFRPANAPADAKGDPYQPDRNEGVRVNIAPLQRAGLLAAPVLAPRDCERALQDRRVWRAARRGTKGKE
ncbi:Eco57I restriction-modification methylase domain-containing protein [Lignipirellula cremea]|uniref:site-specific DNA-methyltransferase (adenine-specific) n=1 Tax=Lignipirellula cremea TaxID=2528010 RepID=A0A518E3Q4_9BACT|nr:DNA methyltransferase [Lignipirellula cremea]QDU98721.1 N-6 DNA Methylase [Lignipirellula cremea]